MTKYCPICDKELHYNDDDVHEGFWACDKHGMVIFKDTQVSRVEKPLVCEICGEELTDLHAWIFLDDLSVCEMCYEHEREDTIQEGDIGAIWLGSEML